MTKKFVTGTETVQAGYANGISTQLAEKQKIAGEQASLTEEEKQEIIEEAALYYGQFLNALGCTWQVDPNATGTPMRVARMFVEDLWAGRYNPAPLVTGFPSDGYTGIIQESRIPLVSMCSHHAQAILGEVSIAYVPSKTGKVVGLSKLNRIVEHFGRRGAIQEQLTVAIHNAINKACEGNEGVAVLINATHQCVACRGVKHLGSSMQTAKLSGCFLNEPAARAEFYKNVELAKE